jgi:hypothetical protein
MALATRATRTRGGELLRTTWFLVLAAVCVTFRPLADQIGTSLTQERLVAMLSGCVGAAARPGHARGAAVILITIGSVVASLPA